MAKLRNERDFEKTNFIPDFFEKKRGSGKQGRLVWSACSRLRSNRQADGSTALTISAPAQLSASLFTNFQPCFQLSRV